MIKIQKKNFNLEEEIEKIKNKHSDIGALTSFVGYVRYLNNKARSTFMNGTRITNLVLHLCKVFR